jgi:hypothetical protein
MCINWNSAQGIVNREAEKAAQRKPWQLRIDGRLFHGRYVRLRGYVVTVDTLDGPEYLTFNTRIASTAKKWLREYESN